MKTEWTYVVENISVFELFNIEEESERINMWININLKKTTEPTLWVATHI